MKRFAICALALALALCTVLCGCGSSEEEDRVDQDVQQTVVKKDPPNYTTGIHHAEMVIEGYEDTPITIEIYSDSARMTASTFARLANEGYYDGKTLFWILNDMYVRIGNTTQDNDYLITGEYEESDIDNSNSLKRGVIALNRAKDGQQSDASSFIIFLSDLSYLDGKYAGFGQVTKGMDVIEEIAQRTQSPDDATKIETDESGKIVEPKECPVVKSIRMVD